MSKIIFSGKEIATLELDRRSDRTTGDYINGIATLPDGRTINVGGGNIHSAESATLANHCSGLQPDTHPEITWPGATEEGDFEPYAGYELGDIDGLASSAGINVDRDTEDGDANWNSLCEAIRDASVEAFAEINIAGDSGKKGDMTMSDTNLICGIQIQHDNSGVGHNWRNIDASEIPADVREEIAGEIIDGQKDECEDFIAGDGLHYRW